MNRLFGHHNNASTTTFNDPSMMNTGSSGGIVTGPKAFHRQGVYHNILHNIFSFLLPILGLATAITALVTTIVGTAIIGANNADIIGPTGTPYAGEELFGVNDDIALWIINASLLPLCMLAGILSFLFSRCAMRHEKTIAKYNNDANIGQHVQRDKSHKLRWLALIPCFLNELLLLGLFGYFLATTIVSHMREADWRKTNQVFGGCPTVSGLTLDDCDDVGRGYNILRAGTIMSLCSTLPFLILNSMALSHLGSREKKSSVMPPQQSTVISANQTALPPASYV
jgi:hypothetical protein